jgi:hypothetical protein
VACSPSSNGKAGGPKPLGPPSPPPAAAPAPAAAATPAVAAAGSQPAQPGAAMDGAAQQGVLAESGTARGPGAAAVPDQPDESSSVGLPAGQTSSSGPGILSKPSVCSNGEPPAVAEEVAVTWVEVPGGDAWWQQLQASQPAAAAASPCAPPTPTGCQQRLEQSVGTGEASAGDHPSQQQQEEGATTTTTSSSSSRVAEPWYTKEKEAGFRRNPLRYPQRFTPDGTRICRPHNYSTCLKAEGCPFDHDHCHHCGALGHRGVGCPVGG